MIKFVALILKDCHIAQHGKAMCKTFRNEYLSMIAVAKGHGYMFAKRGRTGTEVYSYVYHRTYHTPYKFGLRERGLLEMETSYYAFLRTTFVVLHKLYRSNLTVEFLFRVAFKEIPSRVFENPGF